MSNVTTATVAATDTLASSHTIILRDGVEVNRVKTDAELLAWFHKTHSFSMSHALQYEGYSLQTYVLPTENIEFWADLMAPLYKG